MKEEMDTAGKGLHGKGDIVSARIISGNRGHYRILTEEGEYHNAIATGKMYYESEDEAHLPSIGDYVRAELQGSSEAVLRQILLRKSAFIRKAAGRVGKPQVLAANFDYVFIVTSLNYDFNQGRLDRYVSMAWDSGGIPVILLGKADLEEDSSDIESRLSESYPGVAFHRVSSISGEGMDTLEEYLGDGRTAVLLGSSGVGKSSIVNYMTGKETMHVSRLRNNIDKGRHTTTHRELIVLKSGGCLIDTPGMRELGIWHDEDGINTGFGDLDTVIGELSGACRFRNCSHTNEPGCAVKEALRSGLVDRERYTSYQKLLKEAAHMERRIEQKKRIAEKKTRKIIEEKERKRKIVW